MRGALVTLIFPGFEPFSWSSWASEDTPAAGESQVPFGRPGVGAWGEVVVRGSTDWIEEWKVVGVGVVVEARSSVGAVYMTASSPRMVASTGSPAGVSLRDYLKSGKKEIFKVSTRNERKGRAKTDKRSGLIAPRFRFYVFNEYRGSILAWG